MILLALDRSRLHVALLPAVSRASPVSRADKANRELAVALHLTLTMKAKKNKNFSVKMNLDSTDDKEGLCMLENIKHDSEYVAGHM